MTPGTWGHCRCPLFMAFIWSFPPSVSFCLRAPREQVPEVARRQDSHAPALPDCLPCSSAHGEDMSYHCGNGWHEKYRDKAGSHRCGGDAREPEPRVPATSLSEALMTDTRALDSGAGLRREPSITTRS